MGLKEFIKKIGAKTLYFPGCLTKEVLNEEFENYKWIFNKLGVDFVLLSEGEVCCSLPVYNAGYKKEARKLARKNLAFFKKNNIQKIVTNCPSCYHTFKSVYPELLTAKDNWNIEVEHATQTILKALEKKKIDYSHLGKEDKEDVGYHDPCHLGRYEGIFGEPREVIKRLGGNVIEFKRNRENSICCGGGGGLRANFPDKAIKIAEQKMSSAPVEVERVISPCGLCYKNLGSGAEKLKRVKSEEFSSFVKRKLGEKR